MKIVYRFILLCLLFSGITIDSISAQNQSRKITLTPMVSDVLELPAAAKNTLQQKLTQMSLQNGVANRDGDFILTANYAIVEEMMAPTDVAQYVVKLDVMFYVVNLAEGLMVAENTYTVKGYGSSKDKAFLKAFSQINPRSNEALQLINTAEENIISYYTERTDGLMLKANSLANQGQYAEALSILNPIPDCVPRYNDILELQDKLFVKWIDSKAEVYLTEAKRSIALGEYENAYNAILSVNPLSTKFVEAQKLSDDIDKRIQAAQKAAADALKRKQEAEVAIAQAISAAKVKEKEAEIANAQANAEVAQAAVAQANADAANAQAIM